MLSHADRLERLANLTVSIGLNMQPGQIVVLLGLVEHAPLVREIARAAYRAGARRVDAFYVDRHLNRAEIELGPESSLGVSTPMEMAMLKMLEEEQCAFVQIAGEAEPELLSGLDGRLVGKSRPRDYQAEWGRLVGERKVNWTIVPYATEGWARSVFGEPKVEDLWSAIEKAVRLDRDDPTAAWRQHVEKLDRVARALNERKFDTLRYRGP